jgi:uncharacterized repeat protein (TIGR03803 family)
MKRLSGAVAAIVLGSSVVSLANAADLTTIYKFDSATGENPSGGLVTDKTGALYGVAHFFGVNGGGAVFQLLPPSAGQSKWTENILYSFAGGDDGDSPVSGLVRSRSGALFGVTTVGGANNAGTVYMLTKSGGSWTKSVPYSFPSSDGFPGGRLLLDDQDNIYGATQVSIFRLAPPAAGQESWTASTLYAFSATEDGHGPTGGLTGDATALYGTTRSGGSSNQGIVFRLTPPASGDGTWTETILHDFSGTEGTSPNGDLVAKGGNLFGTTEHGGTADEGTVFELKKPKVGHSDWRHSVLYSFSGPDGDLPFNGLTPGKDGSLYGTTGEGGGFGKYGHGTVFQLTPPAKGEKTWTETVLHSFNNTDGNSPGLLLVTKTGAIYGNAQYGGRGNTGNTFQILP